MKNNGLFVGMLGLLLALGMVVIGCGQKLAADNLVGSWNKGGETLVFQNDGSFSVNGMKGKYTVQTMVTADIDGEEAIFVMSINGSKLLLNNDEDNAFKKVGKKVSSSSSVADNLVGSWNKEGETLVFQNDGSLSVNGMNGKYTVQTMVTVDIDGEEAIFVMSIDGSKLLLDNDEDDAFTKVETKVSSSSSKVKYDKLLADYEKVVNDYAALTKKAANGDLSVYTEVPALTEKYGELLEQITEAYENLTPAQSAKLLKIQEKMKEAALEAVEAIDFDF